MPEIRLQKARATLPEGYQFGDARKQFAECPLCCDGWINDGTCRNHVWALEGTVMPDAS